jgi:hypothetical protein
MCRPPKIPANLEARTARRSVPRRSVPGTFFNSDFLRCDLTCPWSADTEALDD